MTRQEVAERIVDTIIDDLTDRRGLRQAWEGIDEAMQQTIRQQWVELVLEVI